MTNHYIHYALPKGYIHNWLVAGPQAVPVDNLERFQGDDFKMQIARHYFHAESGISDTPLERGTFTLGEAELRWEYLACLDDHFVDLSSFHHTCHYLQAWAYTEIVSATGQEAHLVLTTNGPADIWLNDQHIHRQEHFYHQIPHSGKSGAVTLSAGPNRILVRFEAIATRECPYVMALQLAGSVAGETTIRIPLAHTFTEKYQNLERMFALAYLDRDTFIHDEKIALQWPDSLDKKNNYAVRLQQPPGRIYFEARDEPTAGEERILMAASQLPEGDFEALLMPDPVEYYEGNIRITRKLHLNTLRNKYSQSTYGTYQQRRIETLKYATSQPESLYAEIAKMALGWWSQLKPDVILTTIDNINQRRDCSDFYLVGLLGMLYRYGDDPSFPEAIKQPLENCILGFKYWADEPGSDAMWFWSENHQILFHTCQILAGQYYPERLFSNNGQTGQWHRKKGEELALAWLKKRAVYGFQEWDSNCYFEHDLLGLSHLLDLAETDEVWELAALLMDKIFLTMALNSYKGVFGSTHGRSYTPHIKGGYLETTSGIGRLMWGLGAFNQHILGTVSLACNQNYELPDIIAAIATDQTETMWSKERHAGDYDPQVDRHRGTWEVNKVTYKTPDYMLCSAQDYHPGEPGQQQHLWQATMGPDAVVFVNHPACLSEEGAHRPGFWHGNVILPRVAQWQDILIAVHNAAADDWLGFTHAYFPTYAFDEHRIGDGWAFARKGAGYLALTAARGLELITGGQNAYRELRSYGQGNIWLCQMGRAAVDGRFSDFCEKMIHTRPAFKDLSLTYETIRNDSLTFGWEGPLLVNDQEQPLSGFKHYDGPYCAAEWPASIMAIGFGRQLLRLNLAGEEE